MYVIYYLLYIIYIIYSFILEEGDVVLVDSLVQFLECPRWQRRELLDKQADGSVEYFCTLLFQIN